MKPLRTRLQEARRDLGLPWEVLERDYLLSWILAGVGQVPALRDSLVFKGVPSQNPIRAEGGVILARSPGPLERALALDL
ncbi:hypothetical protein KJ682_07375 [bacterium]|nr:hypothetical protein [bacterium]